MADRPFPFLLAQNIAAAIGEVDSGISLIFEPIKGGYEISYPFWDRLLYTPSVPLSQNGCKSAPNELAGDLLLRLRHGDNLEPRSNQALLSSGVAIECNLREIGHPEGRFTRKDGTRYDICVMEVMSDPTLRPPAVSRANFGGDRVDTQAVVIRLGNVRQSSFRLCLISPGEAFGTSTAASKPLLTLPD